MWHCTPQTDRHCELGQSPKHVQIPDVLRLQARVMRDTHVQEHSCQEGLKFSKFSKSLRKYHPDRRMKSTSMWQLKMVLLLASKRPIPLKDPPQISLECRKISRPFLCQCRYNWLSYFYAVWLAWVKFGLLSLWPQLSLLWRRNVSFHSKPETEVLSGIVSMNN